MGRFILVLLFVYSCSDVYSQSITADSIVDTFKIEKIKNVRDNYIIYASRGNALYKIVSQKVFEINAEKIKEGNSYKLGIISYFKGQRPYPLHQTGVFVSPGCIIRVLNHQLYYSWDLTGLYLSPLTHLPSFLSADYPYIEDVFKIKKITRKNGVFLIVAENNANTYWIASGGKPLILDDSSKEVFKLKVDSLYKLTIYSYFEKENNLARIIDGSVEVRPKKLIKPQPITGQLYFTDDIINNNKCYEECRFIIRIKNMLEKKR